MGIAVTHAMVEGMLTYLISFGFGWTFLMRYLASLLFRQLNMAPINPPTTPIRIKKARSTTVHR